MSESPAACGLPVEPSLTFGCGEDRLRAETRIFAHSRQFKFVASGLRVSEGEPHSLVVAVYDSESEKRPGPAANGGNLPGKARRYSSDGPRRDSDRTSNEEPKNRRKGLPVG